MRKTSILSLLVAAAMLVPSSAFAQATRFAGTRAKSPVTRGAARAAHTTWNDVLRRLDRRDLPQRNGAGAIRLATARTTARTGRRVETTLEFERYKKYPTLLVKRSTEGDLPVYQPVIKNPVQRRAYNKAYAYLKKRGYARGDNIEHIDMMEVRGGRFDGLPSFVARTLFSFLGPAYDGRFGPALDHRDVARLFERARQSPEQALRTFEIETSTP